MFLIDSPGWRVSLAASVSAMLSCVFFVIAYWILVSKTEKDHENLTNEEKDWANFVDSKKKVTYQNAFGPKVEFKNQIKYKREVIGGWNWVLPIVLCLLACGLAVLANLYPRLEMHREPKGTIGRQVDKILTDVSMFEDDEKRVKDSGERECLPFAKLSDVIKRNFNHSTSLLMNPINAFYNVTATIIRQLSIIVGDLKRDPLCKQL